MKKGTQSRRRRQPIILLLSQQLYLSTFISPRGAHHTHTHTHTLERSGTHKREGRRSRAEVQRGEERTENIKKDTESERCLLIVLTFYTYQQATESDSHTHHMIALPCCTKL